MIAKVIGGLVVLGIVAYFLVSLGGKAQEAQQSTAVSQLQKQIQDQRSQLQDIEGGISSDQPSAAQPHSSSAEQPHEDEADDEHEHDAEEEGTAQPE